MSTTNQQQKIKVSVLGRGEETVTVNENDTVAKLRSMMALGDNIQAFDEQGKEISEDTAVKGNVNFVPNVQGGI